MSIGVDTDPARGYSDGMSNTTTHTFTVIHGGRHDHNFIVHAAGCRDIARELRSKGGDSYDLTAETAAQAVEWDVADYQAQDQGWNVSDYRIMPCCHSHAPAAPAESEGDKLATWLIG